MYFTVPIQRTNDDGYKIDVNGLSNITLRSEPDFDIDLYSLTAVPNENGVYENTTSISATSKYKMYINGVEEKSWGGTRGRDLIAETNIIDVNDFNVGETITCQSLSGTKYFAPTSLTGAVSQAVIDSISAGVVNSFPKIWLGQVDFHDAGEGGDMVINVFKNDLGEDIRVTQLNSLEEVSGRYDVYTSSNEYIFNSKTFFTFSEIVDGNVGGYTYEVSYPGVDTYTLEMNIRAANGTTYVYPTKSVMVKIEVYP